MDAVEHRVRELLSGLVGGVLMVDIPTFDAMVKTCMRKQCVFLRCVECDHPFTTQNVRTKLGWRETQISGWCETCFDKVFKESE